MKERIFGHVLGRRPSLHHHVDRKMVIRRLTVICKVSIIIICCEIKVFLLLVFLRLVKVE
jgi:hypothetical protein